MNRAIVGAVVLLGCLAAHLGITLHVLPAFAKMFKDFGSELPLATRIALTPTWRIGWTAWLTLAGGAGVVRLASGRRGGLLLAVLGSTSLMWIVSIFAMYLPIFSMASAIHE